MGRKKSALYSLPIWRGPIREGMKFVWGYGGIHEQFVVVRGFETRQDGKRWVLVYEASTGARFGNPEDLFRNFSRPAHEFPRRKIRGQNKPLPPDIEALCLKAAGS